MQGSIVIRPIEANLLHNKDFLTKMDPYCIIHLGPHKVKGQVCKYGGKHPQWGDTITVQRRNEQNLLLELKDKDTFTRDDVIGACQIDISRLQPRTPAARWFPLQRNRKPAGEIYAELTLVPNQTSQQYVQQNVGMPVLAPQAGYQQPNYVQPGYQQPMYQQQMMPQPVMQPVYQQPMQPFMQPVMPMQPVYQQQMQPVYQQQPMQPIYQQQPVTQPILEYAKAVY